MIPEAFRSPVRPAAPLGRLFMIALVSASLASWLATSATAEAPQRHRHEQSVDREIELIVDLLGLQPGDSVADVGADDGLYAVRLAERLGETAHVYANEISNEKVDEIRDSAVRAGVEERVTAIRATDDRSGLPADCCEGIFLRVVYHHLAEPEAMLRQFDAALRDGGRLLIIENPPQRGPNAPGGLPGNIIPDIQTATAGPPPEPPAIITPVPGALPLLLTGLAGLLAASRRKKRA